MSGIFDDDDLWALKTHQGYPWNPCAAHVNIAAIKQVEQISGRPDRDREQIKREGKQTV